MITEKGEVRFSSIERHLATILLGIAVCFLGWIGVKSSETAERLARVEAQLETFETYRQTLADHERRIRALELHR